MTPTRIAQAVLFSAFLICLPLLAHAAPPVITDMRHEAGKVHLAQQAPTTRARTVPTRRQPLVTGHSILPPTLVSARPLNAQWNHIVLQWTHPTVYEFQIRMQSPDQENANLIRFEHRGHYEKEESHGLTNFLEKIKLTQHSSVFSVRAIVGTNVSAWSNPIAVVTSIDNKP